MSRLGECGSPDDLTNRPQSGPTVGGRSKRTFYCIVALLIFVSVLIPITVIPDVINFTQNETNFIHSTGEDSQSNIGIL